MLVERKKEAKKQTTVKKKKLWRAIFLAVGFSKWTNRPNQKRKMFWPLCIFVSSIIVSYKQAQSPFSVPEYCFSHHLNESAHSSKHTAQQGKHVFIKLHFWLLDCSLAGTPVLRNAREVCVAVDHLPASSRCALAPLYFFSDYCCIGMKRGLSSEYNIRERGNCVM